MERTSTPPPAASSSRRALSPPTPELARRIEENRLRAKAIRDQQEAAAMAAGASTLPPKTASGFVATDDIHVVGGASANRKRPYSAVSGGKIPANNRDARTTQTKPGDEGPLRPARNFAKYVDYNFSTMMDTKGGFLAAEDDPHNKAMVGSGRKKGPDSGPDAPEKPVGMSADEWERKQLLQKLQRQKAGPFEPGMSALDDKTERKKCRECESLEIDFVWEEVFHIAVCGACKEKLPDKYSLLTKTEVKQDYLLTDSELRDTELLPHLSKPNPHKSHWHDMMLFLRCQVEEYAFDTRWGSAEALDAEFERREAEKRRRKEAKFKEKLTELKKKTRTDAYRRQIRGGMGAAGGTAPKNFGDRIGGKGQHVHEWGRAVENEKGMTVKSCLECGMEVEELEF